MQDPIGCEGKKNMLKWYDTGAVSGSVLPEPYVTPTGKVDKTTMGISHEYHSAHARPAQRRGKSVFILRLAGLCRMQKPRAALHCITRAPMSQSLRRKSYKKVAALFARFL